MKRTFEIIKMDAELSDCPETGVRYFGYVKAKDNTDQEPSWEAVFTAYGELPWFVSEDELIEYASNWYSNSGYEIHQLLILKAELPIRKMVVNPEKLQSDITGAGGIGDGTDL